MKKLMFAAAAIAAGVAMADVTSANIVGYSTYQLKAAKQDIMGAPFVAIGEDDISIQEIKLDNGSEGMDWIMVFDPATREYQQAFWNPYSYDPTDTDYLHDLGQGWTDRDWFRMPINLNPGQGLWIYTTKACNATVPGQIVAAEQNLVSMVGGKQDIVATMFPVSTSIQDISLSNGTEGKDWMMVFDPETREYQQAFWNPYSYDPTDTDYLHDLGQGWTDRDWFRMPIVLNPGQGLWLYTTKNCNVTFKDPLAK